MRHLLRMVAVMFTVGSRARRRHRPKPAPAVGRFLRRWFGHDTTFAGLVATSRLETALGSEKHAPSFASLQRFAAACGTKLIISLA
ncbi:hypothetical protein [Cupriavidus sp. H19C3]|uniref:hypothetical protein n=1 Tax=Cupriavidus sp. H19C3 TaxID=3241603 RepID=UPI003BF92237